jgi:hypothetical protein
LSARYRIPEVCFLLLLVAAAPQWAAASDNCAEGVFETNFDAIKKSFRTKQRDPIVFTRAIAEDPTPEISRIKDGAVGNFVGAFINDGIETWWAYDAERHLFLRIEALSEASPTANSLSARSVRTHPRLARNQTMRLRGTWTMTLTVVRATPEQALQFACLANLALEWRPTVEAREAENDVDTVADKNSASPAEITVRAPKQCETAMRTDALQDSFSLLKDGHGVSGVLLDRKQCDCACQKYQGSLFW